MRQAEDWLGAAEALLLPLYAQPHRAYHNAVHVRALLAHADRHADLVHDLLAVKLAAWFHDAVYDPASQDNEELSAQLAERTLAEWGCEPARVASVASKVRATAAHAWTDGDPDTALFLDFDLSVLAAPPAVYDAYARQIAAEYAWVPPEAYRAGRAGVLQRFLARPQLYFTERLRAQWETQARANLARELAAG
ncbi:MAG: hypothetical protein RI907_3275 [Pseudomonadota bacterium]|jgi:predicted metal-dependent HD superfamily phosphohydrolase